MTDETIATTTAELPQGTYDENPNVTQPVTGDDMPWLLRDKFRGDSTEDVMKQQAKAYHDLQTKMGVWWGAPKEGDYDTASLSEYGVTADDPILNGMKATFKEMGLSNEAVKKLTAGYDDSLKSMARQMDEKLQKEMTPDLAQAAQRVDSWMNSKLDKTQQEVMKGWLQTPEDFKAFNTLIALNPSGPGNNLPAQGASYGHRYETSASVEREKIENAARYKKDAGYRNEVAQRYRDAVTREQR